MNTNVCSIYRGTNLPDIYRKRWQDPQTINYLLKSCNKIAIVGLSTKPERPSYQVAKYLQDNNFTIVPVNPGHKNILGCKCYKKLTDIEEKIDLVNIFRNPNKVLPVVKEALLLPIKGIWFQFDVINLEAGKLAEKNNLKVVMDKCIKIEHEIVTK